MCTESFCQLVCSSDIYLCRFVNVDSDVASKDLTPQVSEIMMQALVALVKAGPNYTHCEMMSKIMECTPKVQEYAKVGNRLT